MPVFIHETDIIGEILIHEDIDEELGFRTIVPPQVMLFHHRPDTFDDGVRVDDGNLAEYRSSPDSVFVGMVPIFPHILPCPGLPVVLTKVMHFLNLSLPCFFQVMI